MKERIVERDVFETHESRLRELERGTRIEREENSKPEGKRNDE
jgi:hypothetical protein